MKISSRMCVPPSKNLLQQTRDARFCSRRPNSVAVIARAVTRQAPAISRFPWGVRLVKLYLGADGDRGRTPSPRLRRASCFICEVGRQIPRGAKRDGGEGVRRTSHPRQWPFGACRCRMWQSRTCCNGSLNAHSVPPSAPCRLRLPSLPQDAPRSAAAGSNADPTGMARLPVGIGGGIFGRWGRCEKGSTLVDANWRSGPTSPIRLPASLKAQ
jgi:hypothetical protein